MTVTAERLGSAPDGVCGLDDEHGGDVFSMWMFVASAVVSNLAAAIQSQHRQTEIYVSLQPAQHPMYIFVRTRAALLVTVASSRFDEMSCLPE